MMQRHVYVEAFDQLIISGFVGWLGRADVQLLMDTAEMDAGMTRFDTILDTSTFVGWAPGVTPMFFKGMEGYAARRAGRLQRQVTILPHNFATRTLMRGLASLGQPPWQQLYATTIEEAVSMVGAPDAIAVRMRELRASLQVDIAGLTPREREVARHVSEGLSDEEVAVRLQLRASTVGTHLENIYRKLGVHSRLELQRSLLRSPDGQM